MLRQVCRKIITLMDFTSLNPDDSEESVALFLEKAKTPLGHVAAVCVLPQFVRMAAAEYAQSAVKVATVANFPEGNSSLESVLIEISNALQDGVQEIDVVFPYKRYLEGDRDDAKSFVMACKAACGKDIVLKVILETGMMPNLNLVTAASRDALISGADFIKTSTGKVEVGATLQAANAMLLVIKELSPTLKRPVGIKVSGGIRDIQQATDYIELAEKIMGPAFATPSTFRIGASHLLQEIIKMIEE